MSSRSADAGGHCVGFGGRRQQCRSVVCVGRGQDRVWKRNSYLFSLQEYNAPDVPPRIPSLSSPESGAPLDRTHGSLERSQYGLFVKFFRQASPYIEGHRGKCFVIAIPGEVVDRQDILDTLLQDIALLHGLGVRLVVVIGARMQINKAIRAKGSEPRYVKGYRVTDDVAMKAAVAAAGAARMLVEARLSKAPTVTMMRRHARGNSSSSRNQAPAVTTVSGNYVAAKRKGVVGGIDYQHTGSVRFVQAEAVQHQLANGNVVLLSNLGYSASGDPLNCDIYSVSVRAAIDLNADKLIVVAPPDDEKTALSNLPAWLPLQEAEALLMSIAKHSSAIDDDDDDNTNTNKYEDRYNVLSNNDTVSARNANPSAPHGGQNQNEGLGDGYHSSDEEAFRRAADDLDFDNWYELGLPMPLLAACMVCKSGVKRAHLIDASIDGALLLELYSTDGVGSMISSDFYEGIRKATTSDVSLIYELLDPLVEKGILVRRTKAQLADDISYFTVLERESQLLSCAMVRPLGLNDMNESVAELGAFCVHPEYRGGGKGDTLLEFVEDRAREDGVQRLILLTTRTAEWFEHRGFQAAGTAHKSTILPESRRQRIDASRNSQLYYKILRPSTTCNTT